MKNTVTANTPARLIDEMALVLCGVGIHADDRTCILALVSAGFRTRVITAHLDEARALARDALKAAKS